MAKTPEKVELQYKGHSIIKKLTKRNECAFTGHKPCYKIDEVDPSATMKGQERSRANEVSGGNFKNDVLKLLEDEFTCCICEEIVIQVTITKCKHMFCAYCLKKSKKLNTTCPICRTTRIMEREVKPIDEYISKMLKLVSKDLYNRRLEISEQRKELPKKPRRVSTSQHARAASSL